MSEVVRGSMTRLVGAGTRNAPRCWAYGLARQRHGRGGSWAMAMTLQETIDYAATRPGPGQDVLMVNITVSMHDDDAAVLTGRAGFGANGGPTFHPDLLLRDWRPARIVDRAL